MQLASEVDPIARQIGAVNTLIRQPDGSFKGYNTDWLAAISAIERGVVVVEGGETATASSPAIAAPSAATGDIIQSPLRGKTVVVIGAGGAGRALAFGAMTR